MVRSHPSSQASGCRSRWLIGGVSYRNILLFPMGNSNGQANDMVSVYLNYGDQKASEGWHVCAQFCLAISNPSDPTVYIQSRTFPSLSLFPLRDQS